MAGAPEPASRLQQDFHHVAAPLPGEPLAARCAARRTGGGATPLLCIASLALALHAVAAVQVPTTATFAVGATIAPGCQVASNPAQLSGLQIGRLDFGLHSAMQSGTVSVPLFSTADQSLVQCTPGITMQVTVDAGLNASGMQRRLHNGNGVYLPYALFMTTGGNRPLVPGSPLGVVLGASPTALPVMGMVTLPGAGAVAGTYTDTVRVTLSW
ncbi:Csu type fimbrial protein [Xylophilus ampelinus]|uniref:Spore coat protein U-like protein n=1 Tax=Xylophilus ampelinus TaxID=54067 RepID=A0A318SKD0_9BURK|nr:spore coat U domain-containing protein [Xylophilus ampelinus]MCS4510798.1 spore coat U domain-containing protein [Xylophilus ampelinus]PYE76221.1 spore coat protein U-like protein [Xylophilus ampelinus]